MSYENVVDGLKRKKIMRKFNLSHHALELSPAELSAAFRDYVAAAPEDLFRAPSDGSLLF